MIGDTKKDPVIYNEETEITTFLESRFGSEVDDFFVLAESSFEDRKLRKMCKALLVKDKNNTSHTIFFRKN